MRFVKSVHFVSCVMLLALGVSKTNPVWAATNSPNPDFIDQPRPESPPTLEQQEKATTVDVSPEAPVMPEAARKLGYFHKYRSSLSAADAYVYDTKNQADGGSGLNRLSLSYFFLNTWEAGADLQSDGSGALSFGRRWIYSRDKFRPFTRAGIAVRIEPSDQIATVLKLEHYQARASGGFEVLLHDPLSLRVEVEATASTLSLQALALAGVSWAW